MAIFINKFTEKVLEDLFVYSDKAMKFELSNNDHNYTFELANSIQGVKKKRGGKKVIQVEMEDKGLLINKGYSAEDARNRLSRIGIGTYLEELKEWWMDKQGLEEDEAEGAAIATLNKHLDKGYKSKRSGLSGNRGFIDFSLANTEKIAPDIIENRDLFVVALYDELRSLAGKNFKITLKEVQGVSNRGNFSNLF